MAPEGAASVCHTRYASYFADNRAFHVKSKEGKVLKTEVNKSILNHNNSLSDYVAVSSSLTREKIYMSFLTGISLETLLDGKFDFSPFSDDALLD